MKDFIRFWDKVELSNDGCWLWTAGKFVDGYASFWFNGGTVHAHSWFWKILNGPVPEGHELHHTCGKRNCVNPAHLRPVTRQEHLTFTVQPVRTHCKKGHPFSHVRKGIKRCRICEQQHWTSFYSRHRIAILARKKEQRERRKAA